MCRASYYFVLWPTNAQLSHKISQSYMFRHYRVILFYQQLHLNYLYNLVRLWLQTPWRWHDGVETCRSVIFCDIIMHLLVIVQNIRVNLIVTEPVQKVLTWLWVLPVMWETKRIDDLLDVILCLWISGVRTLKGPAVPGDPCFWICRCRQIVLCNVEDHRSNDTVSHPSNLTPFHFFVNVIVIICSVGRKYNTVLCVTVLVSNLDQATDHFVFDVCGTVHHRYNNINSQVDATVTNVIDYYNRLNMFRAIISPILRSTRLCLQLVV